MGDRYTGGRVTPGEGPLGHEVTGQRTRLEELLRSVRAEQDRAVSPAVARALAMAESQLFLGLTYLGYTDQLFPEEA